MRYKQDLFLDILVLSKKKKKQFRKISMQSISKIKLFKNCKKNCDCLFLKKAKNFIFLHLLKIFI